MERNLKYWAYYICKTSAQVVAMIIGMVAIISFFDGAGFFDAFITNLPLYLLLMCLMVVVVYGYTNITTVFPITVAFSSRRKTSIYGMMLVNHIIFAVLMTLSVLSLMYSQEAVRELMPALWPLFIGGSALLMFFGNMVGVFSNKFGRVAGMIVYIIFVVILSVGFGLVIGFMGRSGMLEVLMAFQGGLLIIISIAGVLLDLLSIWLTAKCVEKKDITF